MDLLQTVKQKLKVKIFRFDPFTCQITVFKLHFPTTHCCNQKMPKHMLSVKYSSSIPMFFCYEDHRKIIFMKPLCIRKLCEIRKLQVKKLIFSFHASRQFIQATVPTQLLCHWFLSFLLNGPCKLTRKMASFQPCHEESVCNVKPNALITPMMVVSSHSRTSQTSGTSLLCFFKALSPIPPFSRRFPNTPQLAYVPVAHTCSCCFLFRGSQRSTNRPHG